MGKRKKIDDIIDKYTPREEDINEWTDEADYLITVLAERKAPYTVISKSLGELGIKKSPEATRKRILKLKREASLK